MKHTNHFNPRHTPQSEPADVRQEPNHGGGYSFVVDKWAQLRRFLILGSEGGTYYVSERKLTRDNAKVVLQCLQDNPQVAVDMIADVSAGGRAPKNDAAIFALALGAASDDISTRALALAQLPRVCRIGTHLFQFMQEVTAMRGWSRGLRTAVSRWYEARPEQALMYQLAKYRQRGGWSHRDVMRLAHPKKVPQAIGRWAVGASLERRKVVITGHPDRGYQEVVLPEYLAAFEALQRQDDCREVLRLIEQYRFTHEMIPTEWLKNPKVWEALLPGMPLGALLRNLGRLTSLGLRPDMNRFDEANILKSRLHPMQVLVALKVYRQGHGVKGGLQWDPSAHILDALDEAFYVAFGSVEPTGKPTMLALDVSGSMDYPMQNLPLTHREASAAMAMVVARTERDWRCVGFSRGLVDLPISPSQRLDDVIASISRLPMDVTDCAQPMLYATEHKLPIEVFQVYTDNETNHGRCHPHEALKMHRKKVPNAKLAVIATAATQFTIADPADAGMLDVCGFDTATPNVLAEFVKGL